jgi:hypothetical protein
MPLPQGPGEEEQWEDLEDNFLLAAELAYDRQALTVMVERNTQSFNPEQRSVYNAVLTSVTNNLGKMIFVHSAGGGGKTFVCNTIAAAVRSRGDVALCVASSGIAALLLEGGRTAHSVFKIPIPVDEASVASIKRNTQMHKVLERTKVIIWDEVPMQHRFGIKAVDRCLRDLLQKENSPFGGITVVFGGDFRQTLPVVPRGSRQTVVGASFCRSDLWGAVDVHYLTQNMRLDRTPESDAHATWLLDIGAGKDLDANETVEIPPQMRCEDMDALVTSIYPDINLPRRPDQYFLDRTILSARNDEVDDINDSILAKFPGDPHVLMSADSVELENNLMNGYQPYPPEYLNSLKASGLPLAKLVLKVGCPVMLLRNLDASKGLCNGTRMVVTNIRRRVLECKIISGSAKFAGKKVLIPRIILQPSAETLPIPLKRRQFPVRLAFAMTINKSQGQSVKHVGINLETSVFSHGQLYVALSRCTSGERIRVVLPEQNEHTRTMNVVYKEVLGGLELT